MPAAKRVPRVSIGMPIFNGLPFLAEALDSLVRQTFEDLELIISDNASADGSSELCRSYAERDGRIRYYRNPENVGFVRNQNRVIELAVGRYFLLAHSDDIRDERYLEKTVAVLDAEPEIVVCYSLTRDIDAEGHPLPRVDPPMRWDSLDSLARFRDVIRMDHFCEPDFGLTRLDVLRRTPLHGAYADSDRVLLAELLLYGRFHQVKEWLFFRRAHSGQSTAAYTNRRARTLFFAPEKRGKILFPYFREFREYLGAIRRPPIAWTVKLECFLAMLGWLVENRRLLWDDLEAAARSLARRWIRGTP